MPRALSGGRRSQIDQIVDPDRSALCRHPPPGPRRYLRHLAYPGGADPRHRKHPRGGSQASAHGYRQAEHPGHHWLTGHAPPASVMARHGYCRKSGSAGEDCGNWVIFADRRREEFQSEGNPRKQIAMRWPEPVFKWTNPIFAWRIYWVEPPACLRADPSTVR